MDRTPTLRAVNLIGARRAPISGHAKIVDKGAGFNQSGAFLRPLHYRPAAARGPEMTGPAQ